jgi:hypothetical protein
MTRRLAPSIWLFAALCFSVLISQGCGGGGSNSAPSSGSSSGSAITVNVSPSNATVPPGGQEQFTATVSGTSNTSVSWNVNGTAGGNSTNGTISGSGLYVAPPAPPSPSTVTINAVSQADTTKSGSASLVIQAHHDNQDKQNFPIKLGTGGGNSTDTTTTTTSSGTKTFCCSGTLGSLVTRGGNFYILSNNHVLDKSNQGKVGDPISQPGLADANCSITAVSTVANMSQAVQLQASQSQQTGPFTAADAAIAQIVPTTVDLSGSILDGAGVGQPAPPSATPADVSAAIQAQQTVAKSGDATGLTCGNLQAAFANVQVDYSSSCNGAKAFTAIFKNQILVASSTFSANGDSGSLIMTADHARPLALLYAGGSTNTVGNPIQDVLTALNDPNTGAPTIVGGPDHPISCPAAGQSQVATATDSAALGTQNLTDAELTRAASAKALRAGQLMRDSSILRIEIGSSADAPNQAALVIHATGRLQQPMANVVEGVRTRIVMDSQRASTADPISGAELVRGQIAKSRHVEELMANPAIIGVGVGASNDAPGQSAVVIYVEQGKSAAVPAEIDGVRTRVIVTDRFRTFAWGKSKKASCSRK